MPNLIYQFGVDEVDDLMPLLADNLKRRRLERGLSRDALSAMSGVPTATKRAWRESMYKPYPTRDKKDTRTKLSLIASAQEHWHPCGRDLPFLFHGGASHGP